MNANRPLESALRLTLTAAIGHARALGWTIRRTVDSELVAYPKGAGVESGPAYFDNDALSVLSHVVAVASEGGKVTSGAIEAARHACDVAAVLADAESLAMSGRGQFEASGLAAMDRASDLESDGRNLSRARRPAAAARAFRLAASHAFAARVLFQAAKVRLGGRGPRATMDSRIGAALRKGEALLRDAHGADNVAGCNLAAGLSADPGDTLAAPPVPNLAGGMTMPGLSSADATAATLAADAAVPLKGAPVRTIDMTPTWAETLSLCLLLLERGNREGQATAKAELLKMAGLADAFVALSKARAAEGAN